MKKNEKRMILILVIVAIIIIAVLVKVRNGNSDENTNTTNTGSSQNSTTENTSANGGTTEKYVQELEGGTKLNTSTKLAETKKVGNYEISNIQLTEKNGQSTILADVKNVSNTKIETTFIEIVLLNEDGSQITTVNSMIGEVEAGETVQLNANATVDIANAYDFTINIK